MSPRAAGVLAIAASAGLAVAGGVLIATPPWSIAGALVLVGASILLSVGVVWTRRRSWSEPWPPDVTPSLRARLRRVRVSRVISCVLLALTVGLGVTALITQNWAQLIVMGLLLVTGSSNLSLATRALRLLQEQTAAENRGEPTSDGGGRADAPEDVGPSR